MDNIESPPNTEKEIHRAEIDDLVQALHTFYEFAKMPSMNIRNRFSNAPHIIPELQCQVKSTSQAKPYKDLGDASFYKQEYRDAVYWYTGCLKYGERGSEIVAQAYANRSAALFKLGKYLECKNDIMRAFRAKYPKEKRKTLLERYERCESLMVDPPNPASDAVASSSNQGGGSQEKSVEVDVRIIKEEIDGEWREMCVDLTNPLLRRTSNKIRLECNETWGRHMVASEYIKAGEILSCEKFFSMTMPFNEQLYHMRCSYCYSISYALIPCNLCPKVMYCSAYCRRRAFNLFHRIECRIFRYRELRGVRDNWCAMMALRMLLVGTDQGAGLGTLMKKMTMRDIFAEKVDPAPNKPFSSDYSDVLMLMRTFPKPLLNINSHPGVVVRLILALQKTGYFGQKNTRPQKRLTNTELFTALLLTNHMLSVRSTAFSLNQILNERGSNKIVGKGVPILHNMINHSCNPNAFYLSRYLENALIAVRPISKNEQIFIASCEPYYLSPLRKRQEHLANPTYLFRFTCQCEACIHDWPTGKDLEYNLTETFVGTNNMKAELRKFDEELTGVLDMMSRTEIRHVMSRAIEWLYANLAKPSFANIECEHNLQTFMKYLYDTFRLDAITKRQDLMLTEVSKALIDIQKFVNRLLEYS